MNIQDENTLMIGRCAPFLLWIPAFARMTDAGVSIVAYITSINSLKIPEYFMGIVSRNSMKYNYTNKAIPIPTKIAKNLKALNLWF